MLVSTWIVIESELGAEMPKLMRRDSHTHAPDYRTLNCHSERAQGSPFPVLGYKQKIRTPPDYS